MKQDRSQQSQSLRPNDSMALYGQLDHPPQRVAVTKSMFYAYAAMRGNVDKGSHSSDPLHTSLYLNPFSFVKPQFEQQIDLTEWQRQNDPEQAQEMDGGAIYFHDVSSPMYRDPIPPQMLVRLSGLGAKTLGYEHYMNENLPKFQPNHYTGNNGYGNYGYLEVNGSWVDPDSEGEIYDALNNHSGASRVPDLAIGIGSLLGKYEDEIYSGFMAEVNDKDAGDEEGDPRAMYITPATFAHWAAGASHGDSYVKGKLEPPQPPFSQQRRRKRLPMPLLRPQPQYDEDTGSVFSGHYSPESSPSLVLSARSVEMMNQPTNFSYMNPQGAIELDRAAYGDPNAKQRVQSWLSSSADSSSIICFDEDTVVKGLASSEGSDRTATGIRRWNAYTGGIISLQEEHRDVVLKSAKKHMRRNSLAMEHVRLYREAYFMEEQLKKRDSETCSVLPTLRPPITRILNRPTPTKEQFQPKARQDAFQTTPTRRPSRSKLFRGSSRSMDTAAPPHHTRVHSQPPLPREPPPPPKASSQLLPGLRRTRRFERYFMEQQERQIININKTKATNEHLSVELRDVLEAVQNLKQIHQWYRTSLGIQSVSEIPNLIPVRKKSSDEAGDEEGEEDGMEPN